MGSLVPRRFAENLRHDLLRIRRNCDANNEVAGGVMAASAISAVHREIQTLWMLALDSSSSLNQWGGRQQMNSLIPQFIAECANDVDCRGSLQLAVAKFGKKSPFELIVPFTPIWDVTPPTITAEGCTPFCAMMIQAVDAAIKADDWLCRIANVEAHRPVICGVSDGGATDLHLLADAQFALREKAMEAGIQVHLFGIGERADLSFLNSIAQPGLPASHASAMDLKKLFYWLKQSIKVASTSLKGQDIVLPSFESPRSKLL